MVERRRLRRHLLVLGVAAALSAVLLSATVFGQEDPCRAPATAPAAEIALLPPGLTFERIGTVTRVREHDRHVTVQAVTDKPPGEAAVLIQDAVTAAGYRPAGMDSEGFEAEVFFTAGPFAAGQARVEPSACRGRWDIELVLLDAEAAAAPTP